MRYIPFLLIVVVTVVTIVLSLTLSTHFHWILLVAVPLTLLGFYDLVQTRHNLLRNFPVFGHLRWMFEGMRPEVRQYFFESDTNGSPFNRDQRTLVYERAKNLHAEQPFGTELDVYAPGYEFFAHSLGPKPQAEKPFMVSVGGPGCKRPYDMALLNVSAMSFGALSANAIMALNKGAKLGGFAHDTGEGGLTEYHLKYGGDLIWEIGSGYFGCRTLDGKFDPEMFRDKANVDPVKCISVKLSQGAKPGLGGVMPAKKVTPEIAHIRGVPVGVKCVSPPYHSAFSNPREFLEFLARLRDLADGRPTGFKLCIGQLSEFLGICKAMRELEIYPDFIIVDGGEGGTGAAPLEFEDHVGMPLTDGLVFAHNALVGCGLRDRIKVGCSGKVVTGFEMARRIALGADYCNAARGMMFALGCVQAQACQTNRCPTGVATQNRWLVRGLDPTLKSDRLANYVLTLRKELLRLCRACGVAHPGLTMHDHFDILDERFGTSTIRELFGYEENWGLPSPEQREEITTIMDDRFAAASGEAH